MNPPLIALVGDYSPEVIAHRAIPRALELTVAASQLEAGWRWIHSSELHDAPQILADFSAVWVVPASPYANMAGVLDAIRWARESGKPFLGTCGGFQHALIEFARNVAGIANADHAEINPSASKLVVAPLSCSLVEETGAVHFTPDSRMRAAYGTDKTLEGYHCRFGLNPNYRVALETAGLRFTAFDDAGEVRGFELPTHPFFVATLFQPERAALRGIAPPLVSALVRATAEK
jgi:CTP synthase (UTP-ammonia lyase)